MTRTYSRLWFLLLGAIVVFAPARARADVNYEFMKVNCDPDAHVVVIVGFYDSGESGAKRAKHPGKDTYYLGDWLKHQRKIKCDLGSGRTISIEGIYSDAHPRDDGFGILLSQERDGLDREWTSYRDPIVIVRDLIAPGAFEITTCQEKTISVERECSITRVPYEQKSENNNQREINP